MRYFFYLAVLAVMLSVTGCSNKTGSLTGKINETADSIRNDGTNALNRITDDTKDDTNNYDNKKLWHMCVPYNERLCKSGYIDTRDFVDADYPDKIYDDEHAVYKMIYTKQCLLDKINELCCKISGSRIDAEKTRVIQEKQEIEHAYAVLKKYGLMPNGKQYQ